MSILLVNVDHDTHIAVHFRPRIWQQHHHPGPPRVAVLLVHGAMGNARNVDFDHRSLMASLAHDYDVYALDLRGAGDSTHPDYATIHFADRTSDVVAVAEHIFQSKGPLAVMGHSAGAIYAALLAADHPNLVCGLGLLAGPGATYLSEESLALLDGLIARGRTSLRICGGRRLCGGLWDDQ